MSLHQIKTISVHAIYVPENRHLPLRPDIVEKLTESIDSQGLLQPIVVQPDENHDTYKLIAGRHRLEAMKRLKQDDISATILEGISALDAESAELMENLIRQDLTATQKSLHFARLMEIAEIKFKMKSGRQSVENDSSLKLCDETVSGNRANSAIAVARDTNRSAGAVERDARRVKSIADIAQVVETSLDSGVELDALAQLSPDVQTDLIKRAAAGENVSARTELKKQKRAEKERELGQKQQAFPTGKYSVIYADPPWAFKTFSDAGKDKSPEMHYPTLQIEDIMDLPVGDLAEKNSVLFMWATAPMLPEAIDVMKVWGFTYKSQFVWVKDRIGTGYWCRNQHELLLIGTRGQVMAPAPGSQFPSVVSEPVAEHSKKPEAFYRIIEHYFPNVSKVELFARNGRPGWQAWGNQAPEEPVDEDSWDDPATEENDTPDVSEFDDIFGE
jgi:N6-adenosine-specific RNA methylase IME4/ParB-like chromosome segregation protein Spo0J